MRSFLKEIEQKFIELESDLSDRDYDGDGELESPETEYKGSKDRAIKNAMDDDDDLEEQNVTGAIAGYNTPAAFAKPGKWQGKKAKYESVNTPPTFRYNEEQYQHPESEEEEYVDKFPFSLDDADWQHKNYKYPSVDLSSSPGTVTKKHRTLKVGNTHKLKVEDVIETKYEQLIEGYRDFKSGDVKPSIKVKESIREIAKKLREIETIVNYSTKYKSESGVTSSAYGPSTTKALTEISNRLIKISERIRSLGE
jgi:hypothetical protein